ncbi:uncharacterized protein LOC133205650 [Saccostrea echinata]|uniref:uncharacterized protein LOC133205650 n=1 Tax=Saccostrea echinata TaxID=191078 RepID=UPI002A8166E4|nr:uncharacterized protein LOC133205650 [Saccostrea echinata]
MMTCSGTVVLLMCIIFISLPPSLADRKLCTKRVEGVTTKVPQTRRIPAKCSNWDRAWTWVTHSDCGTKYEITYIELPQHQQYRLVYECCPGEKDCKPEGQAEDESDERFLAITFGCASAAFIILIIIIVISVCRKRHSGFIFCPYKKEYENADESPVDLGCRVERSGPNDYIIGDLGEDRKLVIESEYEEICDINPAAKEADWDNVYQKSPSAPPQELMDEGQEPAQSLTNDHAEDNREPENVGMACSLVETDQTAQKTLVDIEENNQPGNVCDSNTKSVNISGAGSKDILCEDLNHDVLDIKLPTESHSSIALLQPVKAEDQSQSKDCENSMKDTDCAQIPTESLDLVTATSSENGLSKKETVKSFEDASERSNEEKNSCDYNGMYEELK